MPATIALFEHETADFDWTDRDLAALERLNRAAGAQILRATVRGRRRVLTAAQHVGVVRVGRCTIQVLPKIYRSSGTVSRYERVREATRNLLYMLEYVEQLIVREHALAPLLRHDLDWFEILTRLFASHLREEWQRGVYRAYQAVEDDLSLLKGRWRISDHLRRPERRHIFAVAYDEFTSDNRLNRVFRFVVERLSCLTRDAESRHQLDVLRQWMDDVTLLPSVTASDASPSLVTRLNERYEPLLNLARLFLDKSALQLAGGDVNAFAFVFDMNQLFEAFIVALILRHRRIALPLALQQSELLPQSRGRPFYLAQRGAKGVFRVKPDLVFRDGELFPLLVDTKYKQLTDLREGFGISQDDFYQMYAYAQRYDCSRVLLLYPQNAALAQPLYTEFTLRGSDKVIAAATVDVRRDLHKWEERKALAIEINKRLERGNQL